MTVSKTWLEEKIQECNLDLKKVISGGEVTRLKGMIEAYELTYQELTKPPKKKEPTELDHDKAFKKMVKYYVDEKGYPVERAEQIAITAIGRQKQKKLETPIL